MQIYEYMHASILCYINTVFHAKINIHVTYGNLKWHSSLEQFQKIHLTTVM